MKFMAEKKCKYFYYAIKYANTFTMQKKLTHT